MARRPLGQKTGQKNKELQKSKRGKTRNKDMVFLRKELLGRLPLYELSLLNKIKVVLDYLDESAGRSSKRKELRRSKEIDRISSLELVGSAFIDEEVEDRLKNQSKKNKNKRTKIGFQLDHKFSEPEVTGNLIRRYQAKGMDLEVLPINPNYMKYVRRVPMVATLELNQEEI